MPLIKSHHDGNNIIASCAAGFKLHSCSLGTHASILIKNNFFARIHSCNHCSFIRFSFSSLHFSFGKRTRIFPHPIYRNIGLIKLVWYMALKPFFADDVKFYIHEIYPVFLICGHFRYDTIW